MKDVQYDEFKMTPDEIKVEIARVRKSVYKGEKHSSGFMSSKNLAHWWIETLKSQKGCCAYCKTQISLIRNLIDNNLLLGRKVKGIGIRGPNLELERVDHKLGYSPSNCVLICYYCNNDKSNVYSLEEYVKFLAPSKNAHFIHLSNKMKSIKKIG